MTGAPQSHDSPSLTSAVDLHPTNLAQTSAAPPPKKYSSSQQRVLVLNASGERKIREKKTIPIVPGTHMKL